VGFSADGVSAVEFIVKIAAINQNLDPPVALCRSNASLCPVASFYLLLACAAWRLAACLPQATALNVDHKRRCFLSSTSSFPFQSP